MSNVNNSITFGQLNELVRVRGDELIPVELGGKNYHIKASRLAGLITVDSLGLDQVDNTSDMNKPISTATHAALMSKSDVGHQHSIQEVEGLQDELDNKASLVHDHDIGQIVGLSDLLDQFTVQVNDVVAQLGVLALDLDNKASIDHSHELSHVLGLQDALQALQDQITDIEDRPSDNNHNHSVSQITGLSQLLNAKANVNHSHTISAIGDFEQGVRSVVEDMDLVAESNIIVTEPQW